MSPLLKYSARVMTARPVTTFLLVTSMTFVGAAVGGVSSIAAGLERMFKGFGRDQVVLVLSQNAGADFYSHIPNDNVATLTVGPEVLRSSAEVITTARGWVDDAFDEYRVRGLDPAAFGFYDRLRVVKGRLPSAGAAEYMVGATLLLKNPELGLGGKVHLIRNDFTCVGVFTAGPFYASELWTTRAALANDRGRPYDVSLVELDAGTAANAQVVVARVMRQRAVPVDAFPEPRYYATQMTRSCDTYYQMLLIGLVLTICGAAFALASTLSVFFNRRLADMCLLRALGYRRWRLGTLLLFETELLVLVGGLLGALVAFLLLKNFVPHIAMGFLSLNFEVPMTFPIFGRIVGIMAAIGAGASVIPIAWLRRLEIHEGLRE